MEGTPRGIDVEAIQKTIAETPGVATSHDLHIWQVSDGMPMVTVHIVLSGNHHGVGVAAAVSVRIRDAHNITHVTVQPEASSPDSVLVPLKFSTARLP